MFFIRQTLLVISSERRVCEEVKIMTKIIIIIFVMATSFSPLSSLAMTKAEAKKQFKNYSYYDPSRKATKLRNQLESEAQMQCWLGISLDNSWTLTTQRLEYLSILKEGDELVSFNGVSPSIVAEHPLDLYAFTKDIPVSKGDDMSWVVEREGKEVQLTLPCLGERSELVELLTSYASMLKKYKGRKFLNEYRGGKSSLAVTELIKIAADIEMKRGKITQSEYNSYAVKLVRWNIKTTIEKIRVGYLSSSTAKAQLKEVVAYVSSNIDFLDQYGSFSSARLIEGELDELRNLIEGTSESEKANVDSKATVTQQTQGQVANPVKDLLSLCAAKESQEEKLMCFELATQLAETAPSSSRSDSSPDRSIEIVDDLLDAFADISGSVSSGVIYKEYVGQVNQLASAVRKFKRRAPREQIAISPNVSVWIEEALQAHTDASSLWSKQLTGGSLAADGLLIWDPLVKEIRGRWPGLPGKSGSLEILTVRQYLWRYARERIEEVEKELNPM